MIPVLLSAAVCGGVALIGAGVWQELRRRSSGRARLPGRARWRIALRRHPMPVLAWAETALWGLVFASLADHLTAPRDGLTATIVWALTIGPHEIGHVICMPFGWFLHVFGGSLWQVLFWAGPALWALIVRRQVTVGLLFGVVAGHSLIDLSGYIADAAEREMPLLFGMGKDSHDWWNILDRYGLLAYDDALAAVVGAVGAAIVVLCAAAGIALAWLLPRALWQRGPRFDGPWPQALRAAWIDSSGRDKESHE